MQKKIKIEKFLALSGACSRREANNFIKQGRVLLESKILTNVAERVNLDSLVHLDGKVIRPKQVLKIWKYYKPLDIICTRKDHKGRITIFDKLSQYLPEENYLISVGRLDINSEGLILITNHGEFARKMELPSNGFKRVYKVRVYGDIKKFLSMNILDIQKYLGYEIFSLRLSKEKQNTKNHWFYVTLTEGKNREVRNIFKFLDLQVSRLIRIQFGEFKLDSMNPGDLILVKSEKIIFSND
ncbi:MAG: rRNA pseudouridine synthase [Rickettsia sp.]|nr:rRNA pseudouridine synthase [Rickettsia sp.]